MNGNTEMTNNKLTDEQQVADLLFERACPDYLACDICGHYAAHNGGGNYECAEGHRFAVCERHFGRFTRIVPEGWVAVPAEPTGDMLARIKLSNVWTTEALTARYKDMLRAAPRAPYAPAELQEYRNAAREIIAIHCGDDFVIHSDLVAALRDVAAPQLLAVSEPGEVPSPELLCRFVTLNYANYQGAWLCGKSSEILRFLLNMAGHECEKVACTINGVGHLYVRCGDLILDPSIAQFGDYPEIWRGEHPCVAMNYIEHSTPHDRTEP